MSDYGLPPDGIDRLLAVMARLRDPDGGCPWDVQQSFATIAPYTIEEAYEVADAIGRADMADLREELEDLLLQVVFHARMAEEDGAFDFSGVVTAICDKMIRRHPHVFADDKSEVDAAQVRQTWDEIKAQEKADKHGADGTSAALYLDDVPNNLPGLVRAVKLTKKAARVGFDWPALDEMAAPLGREDPELVDILLTRLRARGIQIIAGAKAVEVAARGDRRDAIEAELGDVLFVIANLARKLDVDPERALLRTNQKFIQRFNKIEEQLGVQGKTLEQSDLAEMDALWTLAKRLPED